MSLENFFHDFDLPKDAVEEARKILDAEHVTYNQLLTIITDSDLEEVGIAEESRKAILNHAKVGHSSDTVH
jgi:hypothetical protein